MTGLDSTTRLSIVTHVHVHGDGVSFTLDLMPDPLPEVSLGSGQDPATGLLWGQDPFGPPDFSTEVAPRLCPACGTPVGSLASHHDGAGRWVCRGRAS